jgi:SAM-dependent methyltransferase
MKGDGGDRDRYEVAEGVAFVGRSFEEYSAFFDLETADLAGRRVLDCPAGPGGFVAGAAERGAAAVGVDPEFAATPAELGTRQREAVADVGDQLPEKTHLFTWTVYDDVADRLSSLRRAGRRFRSDLAANPGRYVAGALPDLPFAPDSFDLVCSANLLFLYGDRLDRAFHREALLELLRVGGEVRVFPTVGLDTEPSPHLASLTEELAARGHTVEFREVPYEFQRGADEMLVVD